MPDIAAFKGLRFDPSVAGPLEDVMSPPYDVIADDARAALEARNPYNMVRLILPRDPDGKDGPSRYPAARQRIDSWVGDGALVLDEQDSLTVYEQRYDLHGERRVLRGVLAAVGVGEGPGGVLPHERTYAEIVGDRLELLRATEVDLEPVFCVYEGTSATAVDAIDSVCASEPLARATTDDGIEHLVWRVTDARTITAVTESVGNASVVIADGHHRWRTAQTYAEERRARDGAGPWDLHLALLVDASRYGPSLLPIHRVVPDVDAEHALRALEAVFTVTEAPRGDPEALVTELEDRRRGGARTYVMLDGARAWWLTASDDAAERDALPPDRSAAWRDLDVAVLHHLVFERLLGGVTPHFIHSATEAAASVAGSGIAFLLAAVPFEAVRAVAEAGEAMPQKSTYFVPKPKTGIVLRPL